MKSKEEIIKAVAKNESIPKDYNLFEIYCFLCLKETAKMFYNKQITKEHATSTKKLILSEYEKAEKEWEFEHSMFQEHIQNIKATENARTKLHKMMNGKDEYKKPITEETWIELFKTCMEIISTVFKGEFI